MTANGTAARRTPPATIPGGADLVALARGVAPLVAAEAEAAEAQRHLTDRAVAAMRDTGLYRLLLPRAVGGYEADPVTLLEAFAEIARADGSAGWCLMASNFEAGVAAAYLDDDAVRDLFGTHGDVIAAGQGVPRAHAEPRPGGYWLSGRCGFGSGIAHADIVHTGAIIMENGAPRLRPDGGPEVRVFYHRKDSILLGDNWHVLGLRATGSFDYDIEGVEIPANYSFPFEQTQPLRGGLIYTLGLHGISALGHTAFALGVGRRALDELRTAVVGKANLFGPLTDSPSFREKFALATAQYEAARAYCFEAWGAVQRAFEAGREASLEEIARVRIGLRHSHDVVSAVCTFAHRASGSASLRPGPLQRCYRDIHAGTQHILLSDQIVQDCGRVLLGEAPAGARWMVHGLA